MTTITITEEVKTQLNNIGKKGDTYNDVVLKIATHYEKKLKLSKMQKETIKLIHENKYNKLEVKHKLSKKLGKDENSQLFRAALTKSFKLLNKRGLILMDKDNIICLTEKGFETAKLLKDKSKEISGSEK